MYKLESHFENITQDQIDDFEARTGFSLPDDYKEFLLLYNGGQPSPNEIEIPGCSETTLVDFLYGITNSRQSGDLEREYENHREDLPEGFLPIGHDPGGNGLLMGTVSKSRGHIYYWDNSFFFESSDEDHNTYLLTNTFEELLTSLK